MAGTVGAYLAGEKVGMTELSVTRRQREDARVLVSRQTATLAVTADAVSTATNREELGKSPVEPKR
jgi:hypothetical protein